METQALLNNDKLVLNGHEFTSRFILGSGKYSLELIKAAVEQAGAEILTLALRRANGGELANILDYVPKHVTLATRKKPCALHGLPANCAKQISSKSK